LVVKIIRCRDCGCVFPIDSIGWFDCPECLELVGYNDPEGSLKIFDYEAFYYYLNKKYNGEFY